MGIGTTRKILSVIIAVLMAAVVTLTGALLVMNLTLSNRAFLEENVVSDTLVETCEEQLDAKYAVLEAETGIPIRVFQAITVEYPVDTTLKMAFQNAFGAEDSSFYSSNLVNYFYDLCEDYLEESQATFTEEEVRIAADKAAVIFSETVGLHEVDFVNTKLLALRHTVSSILTVAVVGLVLCVALMLMLYSDKNKTASYLLFGGAGGALGMLSGSLGCLIIKAHTRLQLLPSIYATVVGEMVKKYFLLTAAAGAVLLIVFYAALFLTNRQSTSKRRKR